MNATALRGHGDSRYYGRGMLARHDWTDGPLDHLYLEGSARAGRATTDFQSYIEAIRAQYDSASPYYGAHGGIGYVWKLSEKFSLDTVSKYLWSRLDQDNVTAAGEAIRLGSVDSRRWRTGARFSLDATGQWTPYAGLAWEYEFDGTAGTRPLGVPFGEPSLKGATGIGEMGVRFTSQNSGLSVEANLQGYTGRREGMSGMLRLQWVF